MGMNVMMMWTSTISDIEDFVALKHVRRNEHERDYEDGVNDGRDIGDLVVQII